jgi:hypothetical protein
MSLNYTITVPKNFNFEVEKTHQHQSIASPPLPTFELSQRKQELEVKVQKLASQICSGNSVRTRIEHFSSGPHQFDTNTFTCSLRYPFFTKESQPEIGLPSYFLFKSEDIPAQFKIQDINDPRLDDDDFLKNFAEWMNAVNRKYHLPEIDVTRDLYSLKEFLISLRNPDLFEKMKDFLIGHELNHAADENRSVFMALENQEYTELLTIGVIIGAAILLLSLGLIPFVSLPIVLSLAALGVTMFGASFITLRHGLAKCVEIEEKCDMGAVKTLKDANGGIYHFENSCLTRLNLRKNKSSGFQHIDEKGNNIHDHWHPHSSTRIAYLKQWQTEQSAT